MERRFVRAATNPKRKSGRTGVFQLGRSQRRSVQTRRWREAGVTSSLRTSHVRKDDLETDQSCNEANHWRAVARLRSHVRDNCRYTEDVPKLYIALPLLFGIASSGSFISRQLILVHFAETHFNVQH